jgi:LPXTG-site transpeptidase (sortase) family protein
LFFVGIEQGRTSQGKPMKHFSKLFILIVITFLLITQSVFAVPGDITLISVDSSGIQGNGNSLNPSLSGDGRYMAFQSYASNLVPGDMNASQDVFVYDRNTGTTTRVSVGAGGIQGDATSMDPSISSDGRYVAFLSYASNLVAGDTNGRGDIFVHDRSTGNTTRVSVDSSGVQSGSYSYSPSISADGRYVTFFTDASNLVAGDTNGTYDVFMHDRITGITTRVSQDLNGIEGNDYSTAASLSSDGRYVAYESAATNLVTGDSNGNTDIFVYDRISGITTRVSLDSNGVEGDNYSASPSISADGRYVAYESAAMNLVTGDTNGSSDIFVHDRITGITSRVSLDSNGEQTNNTSREAYISADGRYVAFESNASNLAAGDTNGVYDVFIHDRNTGYTTCLSVDGNGESIRTSISNNGQYVTFYSAASNLAAGDTNGQTDVFLAEPDFSSPQVVMGSGSIPDTDGATLDSNQGTLAVQFNQHVLADGSQHAANAMVNYLLVRTGANGVFDTPLTSSAICDATHTPEGDDEGVDISGISYDAGTTTATLTIDSAFLPLDGGQYRLYVCGEHSIWNMRSIPLNSGANMAVNFEVIATTPINPTNPTNPTITETDPVVLPATGFALGRMTQLPPQDVSYSEQKGLWLEIPELQVELPIVGVPMADGEWDVTWLGESAGWLEGSAYPTWKGNSVLTGHVWNADNTPGVFSELHTLKWGDEVVVHLAGQEYIYEVRSVKTVSASNVNAMLSHEEAPWLTLVTCKGYDEDSGNYRSRVLVRAVLKEIK